MTDNHDVETEINRGPSDAKLARLRAHPSYAAVREKNSHREPSFEELDEHAKATAFESLGKKEKLAQLLDTVLADARNQVRHNAPLSADIVRQIEAIRALVG